MGCLIHMFCALTGFGASRVDGRVEGRESVDTCGNGSGTVRRE
jgi:hypothetical protein